MGKPLNGFVQLGCSSKPQRLKIKANRKHSFPFAGNGAKTQSYTAAKDACSTHLRTVSFDTKYEFLLFSEKGKQYD